MNDGREESLRVNFKCKKCERSLQSLKDLEKHFKDKHHEEIKCEICSETFSKNSDLEVHIKNLHTEKENFKCEEFGKIFVLKTSCNPKSSFQGIKSSSCS